MFLYNICIEHLDSHHKLIRWRLVTHGGIDGFSRLIVFLKCASNIKSATVYESFLEAVTNYHLPSRIRTDQGRENVLVVQHMIEHRGAHRQSAIVGSSVHNQRIERLWRDMHECVTSLYYRLFHFMEQYDLLDPTDEQHLFALHYVYIPRINKALSHFTEGWNHHPMRTTHQKSPHQLFTAGALLLRHSQLTAFDFYEDVGTAYGIDNDGPVPSEDPDIHIPSVNYNISAANLRLLHNTIPPLGHSDEHGIDIYLQALYFLDSL